MNRTMRRMTWAAATMLVAAAPVGRAQALRLANGAPLSGEPVKATPEGLEIRTPRGEQTLPWETLSMGTRYRHQPGFRENISRILAGEDVAIEPPPLPVPSPVETTATPSSPATSFTPVTAQAQTPKPAPRPATPAAAAPMPFPEGTFANVKMASIFGLSFGPEPRDILYMGDEIPADKNARPDKLFVVSGDRRPETPVQAVPAINRSAGTYFEGMKWTGHREDHEIEAEIEVQYRGGARPSYTVAIRLNARKAGAPVRYYLLGREVPWASPPKAPPVTPVFATPSIKARFTEGGRKMIAMVKVGVWDILPVQGPADQQLQYEVVDARGRTIERGRVKIDESALRAKSEAWEKDLKRMKGGETYQVKLSMNLGELFGVAAFEQSITAIDLK